MIMWGRTCIDAERTKRMKQQCRYYSITLIYEVKFPGLFVMQNVHVTDDEDHIHMIMWGRTCIDAERVSGQTDEAPVQVCAEHPRWRDRGAGSHDGLLELRQLRHLPGAVCSLGWLMSAFIAW